jgi:endonuclease YncB( thermonuclease family)
MKRLLSLLILLIPFPALAEDYAARVVGISDGDTLTVLKADKTQVKIRLSGIDAPETGQDFGSKAKQTASELAFGKDVTIQVKDKDRYGRTVAVVILGMAAPASAQEKKKRLLIIGQSKGHQHD